MDHPRKNGNAGTPANDKNKQRAIAKYKSTVVEMSKVQKGSEIDKRTKSFDVKNISSISKRHRDHEEYQNYMAEAFKRRVNTFESKLKRKQSKAIKEQMSFWEKLKKTTLKKLKTFNLCNKNNN